jgi:hypothetical protein
MKYKFTGDLGKLISAFATVAEITPGSTFFGARGGCWN